MLSTRKKLSEFHLFFLTLFVLSGCEIVVEQTVITRSSSNIDDILREESQIEDEVLSSDPVDISAPRTKDEKIAPEDTATNPTEGTETTDGANEASTEQNDIIPEGDDIATIDPEVLAERLRTSAVSADNRDAFIFYMDGFVKTEKSLTSHILTAPYNLYKVSSTADTDSAGTLRNALQSSEVNFIVFDDNVFTPGTTHSIDLTAGPIYVEGNKTLLSVHGNVVLRLNPQVDGLRISGKRYVVLRNLIFDSLSPELEQGSQEGFAIRVTSGSTDVWIDQNKFKYCGRSCVHIEKGSVAQKGRFSVSRNVFDGVAQGLLVEDSVEAGRANTSRSVENIWVSLYDNIFENVTQFALQVQNAGYVHAYNNYFKNWTGLAMITKDRGKLNGESNIFENSAPLVGITDLQGCSFSNRDLFLGQSRLGTGNCPDDVREFHIDDEPHTVEDIDGFDSEDLSTYLNGLSNNASLVEATIVETLGKTVQ